MTRQTADVLAKPAAEDALSREDAEVDTGKAQVTRWQRYGKDRLYVTAADGTKIGWRDLLTGQDHLEVLDLEREFRDALVTSASGVEQQPPAIAVAVAEPVINGRDPEHHLSPESKTGADWEDLARHRPGLMAREQAVALKQAAPVRTFLPRALGVHTDERAWRVGADGEELVAAQLHRLARKDPHWRFLHAIPVGEKGSDIDHLAVGPGGVFTLNAKHHPRANVWVRGDTFMVNGQRFPYIRNSRHEATRAARLLTEACDFPVVVTGVVVPVGANSLKLKDTPADIAVVPRSMLRRWLTRQPATLTEGVVDAIYEKARRSTTWRRRA